MAVKHIKIPLIFLPLLSLGLSACSPVSEDNSVTTIRVLNWEDYIYEQDIEEGYEEIDLVDQFVEYIEGKYPDFGKVKVIYETTDTNETMFNEIQTGKSSYDLICPSDYMIQKLMAGNHLEKLDRNLLPNYVSYVSPYMKSCLDDITVEHKDKDGNITKVEYVKDYAAGYMWGTLGLVFNPEYETFQKRGLERETVIEDMSTYSSLWDEKYKQTISVKDSMRDTYAIGVLEYYKDELQADRNSYLRGNLSREDYSKNVSDYMNSVDSATRGGVSKLLADLKQNIFGLEVDSGKQDIVTGKIGINFAWSGDAVYSMSQAEEERGIELLYSVPELGSNIWFDGWVMPKSDIRSEKQRELAHMFIDFLSMPENAAQNVNYIGYTSFVGGNSMYELFRDWYDIRTELMYEDDYSLMYIDPNTDEEVEVSYSSFFFEKDIDHTFDNTELYYYDDEENKHVISEKYNERLLLEESYKVDLTYFFENTLEDDDELEIISDDYFLYSDYYLPFENNDGSSNISVGGAFFCQLPDLETMTRCAVMKDFGDENKNILLMWENFKSDPLPNWAIILFSVEIGLILFFVGYYFIGKYVKHQLRKKRKSQLK